MYTIGITGPTGAGKTTALGVLAELGGTVIDCDAVYHELLTTDESLLAQIEAAFPGVVREGTLDRKALGKRVYNDPAAMEQLTDLTWPAVRQAVKERLSEAETCPACHSEPCPERSRRGSEESVPPTPQTDAGCTMCAPAGFAVIDAIGLFESGLADLCNLTVAVIADEEVRVKRLMRRDSIDEAYARARIAAQKPAEWFAAQADLVLENNTTQAAFAAQCREAFSKYLPYAKGIGEGDRPQGRWRGPPPTSAHAGENGTTP